MHDEGHVEAHAVERAERVRAPQPFQQRLAVRVVPVAREVEHLVDVLVATAARARDVAVQRDHGDLVPEVVQSGRLDVEREHHGCAESQRGGASCTYPISPSFFCASPPESMLTVINATRK
eukprot:246481-Rhodomonas_salina.1